MSRQELVQKDLVLYEIYLEKFGVGDCDRMRDEFNDLVLSKKREFQPYWFVIATEMFDDLF